MKRIGLLIVVIFLFCDRPLPAYASAEYWTRFFYLKIMNPPKNAAYADILVKIDEQTEGYTRFNPMNAFQNGEASGINAESEIIGFNQDGYMSLSFHYSFVRSNMSLNAMRDDERHDLSFALNPNMQPILNSIKIALLDVDGNVIQVSQAINMMPPLGQSARSLTFDADGGALLEREFASDPIEAEDCHSIYISPVWVFLFILAVMLGLCVKALKKSEE